MLQCHNNFNRVFQSSANFKYFMNLKAGTLFTVPDIFAFEIHYNNHKESHKQSNVRVTGNSCCSHLVMFPNIYI
jgi:hypothetical protein